VGKTASGADRDDEECIETQRLTGRDCNSIQCNSMYDLMFFVVTKYTTFILLFRCHMGMDFDMRQREGTETVSALPWCDFGHCSGVILHHSLFDHFPVSECGQTNVVKRMQMNKSRQLEVVWLCCCPGFIRA
jgi:hypothetical protein